MKGEKDQLRNQLVQADDHIQELLAKLQTEERNTAALLISASTPAVTVTSAPEPVDKSVNKRTAGERLRD